MTEDNGRLNMALLKKDIEYIKLELADIKEKLEGHYVTRDEFAPVRSIVYGMVGTILLAVLTALVGLVLTR